MKTKKMTRVSFSAESHSLDVSLPKSWPELSPAELQMVFKVIARYPPEDVPVMVFRGLTGMRVLRSAGNDFICRFSPANRKKPVAIRIRPEELAELLRPLDFLFSPGSEPVRIPEVDGCKAVDALLHGVPFSDYIRIESLYQGFIFTQAPEAFAELAGILYPGATRFGQAETVCILNWMVQLKAAFSEAFPNFFRPASGEVDAPSMLDVINNEIRALTGGDLEKEPAILAADCWRALTELDFKAKEAEEHKRMMARNGR